MNDSLWTFLFELANFVGLAAVLGWLFFKPVRQALADQQAKTLQLAQDAEQKRADAEQKWQEMQAQRTALANELETRRVKSRDIVKREAEQILSEARAQVERERAALKREALHIEQAQIARISKAIAATTRQTILRFLQQIHGLELEQALLQAACRELETLDSNSLAPVTIESATALDGETQHALRTALRDAAQSADFRVVPELAGGLRITTAHGLIDASVKGLANFAEQALSAEMDSIIREEAASE